MFFFIPYLLAFLGVVFDWLTTQVGLSRGFYETHSVYTPANALLIFMAALFFLEFILGDFQYKRQYQIFIACMSFLGAINNTLVLLGLTHGWIL